MALKEEDKRFVLIMTRGNKFEMEEIKNMMKEILVEVKNNSEELRQIKAEIKKKEEIWEKEKNQLEVRIVVLEDRLEKQERNKRRNNTIIKGIRIDKENIVAEIEKFVNNKLHTTAIAKKAYKMRNKDNLDMYMVEWENWEDKKKVMENKAKLRGQKIYIDNDLTIEEQKVQRELRSIAKEERNNGCKTKIGYRKITINNTVFIWNDNKQGIEEEENRGSVTKNY